MNIINSVTMEIETDPATNAASRVRAEQFEKNWRWLEAHAGEVYQHRGKIICVAGQELFVGDDVKEVLARARTAHPDDGGMFTRIIPVERGPRIYAFRRQLATL